ncbi:MAG: AAA family ATPase [Caulobacteraceae bacterium]
MRPNPTFDDDFDAGFEAADEFTSSAAPASSASPPDWTEAAIAAAEAEARAPRPADAMADPFADLPPIEAPDQPRSSSREASPGASAYGGGVPRISVHAFAEKPQTASAIDQASRDRRMARAATQIRPGGLAAAVEYYQNQPTPPLLVVESSDRAPVLLGLLDQLAEVCDPGTKVMIIGATNDIALYRELVSRGVSEYLVPPIEPLQFIAAVSNLYADPSAPFAGRQIAFVGAKGGTGASTIAHNFAYALSEGMQANTVIADFDLAFGTAGLDYNQDPIQGVAHALSQPERLDPVLIERMMARCTDHLSLFGAPATLDDDYDIGAEAAEDVAGKIRATAPFVVLDLPHVWSAWMRRLLLSSDDVVIVATPDLASLRNAKNMIDLLRAARPNDAPPRLVLNQVGVKDRPEIPVKEFAAALGVEPALVLPFDPKLFGKAANDGQMIMQIAPKSRPAEGIGHLAQLISRREPAPAPSKKAPLASLFKRK